jgi:hypothetical protein
VVVQLQQVGGRPAGYCIQQARHLSSARLETPKRLSMMHLETVISRSRHSWYCKEDPSPQHVRESRVLERSGAPFLGLLTQADIAEPVGPTVLLAEEVFALVHLANPAALALGRVGTVEEGDVLIANIPEPVSRCGQIWLSSESRPAQLTSGSCSHLRIGPEQCCAPARHPTARRRTRQPGQGG